MSDCGAVLGVPRTPTRRANKGCYSSDESRPASPEPIKEVPATRSPAHTARSLTQSDQDGPNTHEDMSSLSEQAWDPYQVRSLAGLSEWGGYCKVCSEGKSVTVNLNAHRHTETSVCFAGIQVPE